VPVRGARGFARVRFKPGERRDVTALVDRRSLSYWEPDQPLGHPGRRRARLRWQLLTQHPPHRTSPSTVLYVRRQVSQNRSPAGCAHPAVRAAGHPLDRSDRRCWFPCIRALRRSCRAQTARASFPPLKASVAEFRCGTRARDEHRSSRQACSRRLLSRPEVATSLHRRASASSVPGSRAEWRLWERELHVGHPLTGRLPRPGNAGSGSRPPRSGRRGPRAWFGCCGCICVRVGRLSVSFVLEQGEHGSPPIREEG
jgi:hypothetical protein